MYQSEMTNQELGSGIGISRGTITGPECLGTIFGGGYGSRGHEANPVRAAVADIGNSIAECDRG
jgi:hypothetical protein